MTANDQPRDHGPVDFFISYTSSDVEWARWIAWELARAGHTYRMQEEHFPPGARFLNEMQVWLQTANHVLAILSPAYFESPFATLEMRSAVVADPLGEARRVIPVRVKPCAIPALFNDLVYIEFVGKTEETQRRALIAGLRAAMVGERSTERLVKKKPTWPGGESSEGRSTGAPTSATRESDSLPLRVQFVACDVGRGLDLRGQYKTIQNAIGASRFAKQVTLHADFDVTDVNLFSKLNAFRPHVVHISGNQNGGDVLLPSHDGGEVVVSDVALAGLLSSLGGRLRLAIVDTCKSYQCARRVSEAVDCVIGVDDDIYDDEATRFYEVFYQAIGAGHSIADAHGQAMAALQFMRVPLKRVPKLCVKPGLNASLAVLLGEHPTSQ